MVPVRASVYPAGSGTVSGTGNIPLTGSTQLVYHALPYPWENAIVEVTSRTLGRIIYGEFASFEVNGVDSLDYDLSSFVFTKEYQPLPDGTNVQVFIYPANKYTIEGPKIVANGETVNLRIVGVDLTRNTVKWFRNEGNNSWILAGTGERLSFVKTLEVEIIECGVDPIS